MTSVRESLTPSERAKLRRFADRARQVSGARRAEFEAEGFVIRPGLGNPAVWVAQHGPGGRSARFYGDTEDDLFEVLQWRGSR